MAQTDTNAALSKVPAVTLTFWIIKILATTLGETGADTVSMTMKPWFVTMLGPVLRSVGANTAWIETNIGYIIGTAIFLPVLVILVLLQIVAKRFHPALYWLTIIASTLAGTTMADFADRSLGIGYVGGSLLLFALVMASLAVWYRAEGTVSVQTVNTPRVEAFYWITITFSQTLGTALGDWAADSGLEYLGGALVFGAALAVVAALYHWTRLSRVTLFWTAFILTRPLGATVGDFFDKPIVQGGLNVSRPLASAILALVIVACILAFPQRAGTHPGSSVPAS